MKKLIVRINCHISKGARSNIAVAWILRELYVLLLPFDHDFQNELNLALLRALIGGGGKKELQRDILKEFVRTSTTPIEYASFGFLNKSINERNEYVPDYETVSVCKRTKGNNILPEGKDRRYQMFKKYFHRRVLCISSDENITEREYSEFVRGLNLIVCKPVRGTKGHGVRTIKSERVPTLESFKSQYPGDYLLEEIIQQGDELAEYHPASVNTVRIVSGIDKQGIIHNIFSYMRCGRGDSFVDNTSSGGIAALIDSVEGVISTDAYEYGSTKQFKVHPDTGVMFCGRKIPDWEKLCSIAHDIHEEYPGQFIFGFDFAWTKNGWDLVEVNPAPSFDSYQQFTGKGIRPYLKSIEML